MTSRGQTPYPISTIFNRLPQGTIANMLTENEDPTSKTVGPSVFTDRYTDTHTHTHTHTQIDRHDQLYDSRPSKMGNYNKGKVLREHKLPPKEMRFPIRQIKKVVILHSL